MRNDTCIYCESPIRNGECDCTLRNSLVPESVRPAESETSKPIKAERPAVSVAAPCSAHSAAAEGGDIVLVFDTELRRPACVLLQAVYGCGQNNGLLQRLFNGRTWLVAPTKGMRRIAGTREQWERMGAVVNAQAPDGPKKTL